MFGSVWQSSRNCVCTASHCASWQTWVPLQLACERGHTPSPNCCVCGPAAQAAAAPHAGPTPVSAFNSGERPCDSRGSQRAVRPDHSESAAACFPVCGEQLGGIVWRVCLRSRSNPSTQDVQRTCAGWRPTAAKACLRCTLLRAASDSPCVPPSTPPRLQYFAALDTEEDDQKKGGVKAPKGDAGTCESMACPWHPTHARPRHRCTPHHRAG
jgi:hypothetical protein